MDQGEVPQVLRRPHGLYLPYRPQVQVRRVQLQLTRSGRVAWSRRVCPRAVGLAGRAGDACPHEGKRFFQCLEGPSVPGDLCLAVLFGFMVIYPVALIFAGIEDLPGYDL